MGMTINTTKPMIKGSAKTPPAVLFLLNAIFNLIHFLSIQTTAVLIDSSHFGQ